MTKVISFCFDDGFFASTTKTVKLFEERGQHATFCVMAEPLASIDPAHAGVRFAGWELWRELRAGGHDVAPHGWAHERLIDLPVDEARGGLQGMIDRFEHELPGFRADLTIFHAAYLQLPDSLQQWLLSIVRAVRVATGNLGANDISAAAATGLIDCITFGPIDVAAACRRRIRDFSVGMGEWQVLVLHGLDGEGWGALAADELARLLDDTLHAGIAIQPVSQVLGPTAS